MASLINDSRAYETSSMVFNSLGVGHKLSNYLSQKAIKELTSHKVINILPNIASSGQPFG